MSEQPTPDNQAYGNVGRTDPGGDPTTGIIAGIPSPESITTDAIEAGVFGGDVFHDLRYTDEVFTRGPSETLADEVDVMYFGQNPDGGTGTGVQLWSHRKDGATVEYTPDKVLPADVEALIESRTLHLGSFMPDAWSKKDQTGQADGVAIPIKVQSENGKVYTLVAFRATGRDGDDNRKCRVLLQEGDVDPQVVVDEARAKMPGVFGELTRQGAADITIQRDRYWDINGADNMTEAERQWYQDGVRMRRVSPEQASAPLRGSGPTGTDIRHHNPSEKTLRVAIAGEYAKASAWFNHNMAGVEDTPANRAQVTAAVVQAMEPIIINGAQSRGIDPAGMLAAQQNRLAIYLQADDAVKEALMEQWALDRAHVYGGEDSRGQQIVVDYQKEAVLGPQTTKQGAALPEPAVAPEQAPVVPRGRVRRLAARIADRGVPFANGSRPRHRADGREEATPEPSPSDALSTAGLIGSVAAAVVERPEGTTRRQAASAALTKHREDRTEAWLGDIPNDEISRPTPYAELELSERVANLRRDQQLVTQRYAEALAERSGRTITVNTASGEHVATLANRYQLVTGDLIGAELLSETGHDYSRPGDATTDEYESLREAALVKLFGQPPSEGIADEQALASNGLIGQLAEEVRIQRLVQSGTMRVEIDADGERTLVPVEDMSRLTKLTLKWAQWSEEGYKGAAKKAAVSIGAGLLITAASAATGGLAGAAAAAAVVLPTVRVSRAAATAVINQRSGKVTNAHRDSLNLLQTVRNQHPGEYYSSSVTSVIGTTISEFANWSDKRARSNRIRVGVALVATSSAMVAGELGAGQLIHNAWDKLTGALSDHTIAGTASPVNSAPARPTTAAGRPTAVETSAAQPTTNPAPPTTTEAAPTTTEAPAPSTTPAPTTTEAAPTTTQVPPTEVLKTTVPETTAPAAPTGNPPSSGQPNSLRGSSPDITPPAPVRPPALAPAQGVPLEIQRGDTVSDVFNRAPGSFSQNFNEMKQAAGLAEQSGVLRTLTTPGGGSNSFYYEVRGANGQWTTDVRQVTAVLARFTQGKYALAA